jgi:hypothetical protein
MTRVLKVGSSASKQGGCSSLHRGTSSLIRVTSATLHRRAANFSSVGVRATSWLYRFNHCRLVTGLTGENKLGQPHCWWRTSLLGNLNAATSSHWMLKHAWWSISGYQFIRSVSGVSRFRCWSKSAGHNPGELMTKALVAIAGLRAAIRCNGLGWFQLRSCPTTAV